MPFPVTDHEIARTESALGRTFPLSFRFTMLRENGGIELNGEAWFLLPFRDSSSRKRVARTASDILTETERLRSDDLGLPSGAAVIAENGGGDYLILRPHMSDSSRYDDQVWVWRLRGAELEHGASCDTLFDA